MTEQNPKQIERLESIGEINYIAGADGVVSPNAIGALRMASEMIRPTVVDFLDKMLRSSQGTLRFNELILSENRAFSGKTIRESGVKDKFGLLRTALPVHSCSPFS